MFAGMAYRFRPSSQIQQSPSEAQLTGSEVKWKSMLLFSSRIRNQCVKTAFRQRHRYSRHCARAVKAAATADFLTSPRMRIPGTNPLVVCRFGMQAEPSGLFEQMGKQRFLSWSPALNIAASFRRFDRSTRLSSTTWIQLHPGRRR